MGSGAGKQKKIQYDDLKKTVEEQYHELKKEVQELRNFVKQTTNLETEATDKSEYPKKSMQVRESSQAQTRGESSGRQGRGHSEDMQQRRESSQAQTRGANSDRQRREDYEVQVNFAGNVQELRTVKEALTESLKTELNQHNISLQISESPDGNAVTFIICMIKTRPESDIPQCLENYKGQSPAVLIVMHGAPKHNDDSINPTNHQPLVDLTVDVMYWNDTYFECNTNDHAIKKLVEYCAQRACLSSKYKQ